MDHPEGASETDDVRLGFDRWMRMEFHGSKISSDGGLLLFRELAEVLGLHDNAGGLLRDTRTGHNRLHSLVSLLRQSVFGRWPDKAQNEARLQLHALAHNLGVFLQGTDQPEEMADWSLTSLQTHLFKIGAGAVRHAQAIAFQLAEVAVSGDLFRRILTAIHVLRAPPVAT